MKVCEVIRPGPLSMVQDLGRRGHSNEGIPSGGAFDSAALRLGNALLGNAPGAAGLEVLLWGLQVRFLEKTCISITGGDLMPKLDGRPAPMWKVLRVEPGQELVFTGRRNGMRAYILFSGGLDVPLFMESRSTYLFLEKGGVEGRKLKKGDILEGFPASDAMTIGRVPDCCMPTYGPPWVLRMVLGLQCDLFLDESLVLFESEPWMVHYESNRMAIRLQGPQLKFKDPSGSQLNRIGGRDPSNIPTEGNPLGALQCPAGPQLIAIGPDGPCEGGYAKLGAIISADLFLLAQVRPGDEIRFKSVSLEEAYRVLYDQRVLFERAREQMGGG